MPSKIRSLLTLLRVRQYYKNGLIFFGLFFSEKLFTIGNYLPFIIGFIVLCCASSVNYIINDIKDIADDKKHPEKLKKKPLASGEVSITFALIIVIVLSIVIIVSWFFIQNLLFFVMVLMLLITGQLYNHLLKKYAFVDVIILSLGYLWRALAGSYLIQIQLSPWLFIAIFEIAMFLSIAKRKGDLMILGEKENAIEHKKVYNVYTQRLLDQFYIMIGASLFITYAIYLIFHFNLNPEAGTPFIFYEYLSMLSIPVFLYIIMRYIYLTTTKPEIARNPERAIFDKGMILAGLILVAILSYSYYFGEIIASLF
ncbi:MAG: UbiA prenyltransferase family protein [Promethearchaeota archaeon]